MKTTVHLIAVSLAFLSQQLVIGCPDCNVFNFLYSSVRSSPNIVVGTVTGQVDESTARVRVDRVIRGTNQVNQIAQFRLYGATNHIGRQFIFSDPTECCPDFPALPVDGEWEVGFLVRNAPFESSEPFSSYSLGAADFAIEQTPARSRPRVKSADEALHCLKGVSIVTRELGIQYVKSHSIQILPLLQKELQTWIHDLHQAETNSLAAHRLEGLVEGLWATDTNAAQKFFAADFTEKLGRPSAMISTNIPEAPTLMAVYLCSVLQTEKAATGQGKFQEMLLEKLPSLQSEILASSIYALGYSDPSALSSIERITQKIVQQTPEQQYSVASGFYQIGLEKARWWAWEKARSALVLARKNCVSPEGTALAELIDKQLDYIDQRNKKR